MKKIKYIVLVTMMIVISGCVRYDSTMDFKINKSMNLSMIMAFDKTMISMMGSEDPFEELDKSEAEKYGFKVSSFEESNMKGIKLEKKIKNIDQVSIGEENIFDLSNLTQKDENFIFQIKKGFFKNTYIAKIKFETNGMMNELPNNDSSLNDSSFDLENSPFENLDYESMMASMDLKFNVHLPFGAISNNATNASNHNKDLVWDLTQLKNQYIEFEFSLYNWIPLLVLVFVLIFFIMMMIFIIKKSNKNKENKKNKNLEPLPGLEVAPIPIPENNNQVVSENRVIQPSVNGSIQPSILVQPNENNVISRTTSNTIGTITSPLNPSLDVQPSFQPSTSIQKEESVNVPTIETISGSSNQDVSNLNDGNHQAFSDKNGTQVNGLYQDIVGSEKVQDVLTVNQSMNNSENVSVPNLEQSDQPRFGPTPFNSNEINSTASTTIEQNSDLVNGQIMQDLKVEDVFNVTQIQENENGQIKNPNDHGI